MTKENLKLSITNKTKGKLPALPFVLIKDKILGKNYELSIAIIGDKKMKDLNNKWREKNHNTNILSFPISENSGEIFLNLKKVKLDAPNFEMNYRNFLGFLFIHGCLHLKGMQHSAIMERQEEKFAKLFNFK